MPIKSKGAKTWLATFHWMRPVQFEGELRAGYDTRFLTMHPAVEFKRLHDAHGGNVSLVMAKEVSE